MMRTRNKLSLLQDYHLRNGLLRCLVLRTFLRSMDVKVGKLNGTKAVLQLQLLQWYNGTAVRDMMSSKKKKKGAKSTKPPVVTQDGTYCRVINTILHHEMKPT